MKRPAIDIKSVITHVPAKPTDAVSIAMLTMIGKKRSAPMCDVRGMRSKIAAMICAHPMNS